MHVWVGANQRTTEMKDSIVKSFLHLGTISNHYIEHAQSVKYLKNFPRKDDIYVNKFCTSPNKGLKHWLGKHDSYMFIHLNYYWLLLTVKLVGKYENLLNVSKHDI